MRHEKARLYEMARPTSTTCKSNMSCNKRYQRYQSFFDGVEEAEQNILGMILWNQEQITKAKATLTPKDFRYEKHQLIFQAMLTLERQCIRIDVYSLWSLLHQQGKLYEAGGSSYLTYLPVMTIHDN